MYVHARQDYMDFMDSRLERFPFVVSLWLHMQCLGEEKGIQPGRRLATNAAGCVERLLLYSAVSEAHGKQTLFQSSTKDISFLSTRFSAFTWVWNRLSVYAHTPIVEFCYLSCYHIMYMSSEVHTHRVMWRRVPGIRTEPSIEEQRAERFRESSSEGRRLREGGGEDEWGNLSDFSECGLPVVSGIKYYSKW